MADHDHDHDHDDHDIIPLQASPGFRFFPTEEELICFYLRQKLRGGRSDHIINRVIPVVYIYDYNPWDLPNLSGEQCRGDPQLQEWFFFIPKQKKEAAGGRPNRLTDTGYWKATGSPGYVYSSTENKIIGVKRTMVFYNGRARSRSGSKTEWKMNEYVAVDDDYDQASSSTNPPPPQKGDFTVCRVYIKSKCLRAFDRRPAAPPINRSQPLITHHHHHHDHQPSSSNHHHHQDDQTDPQPRAQIVRCISSESSSSSGDNQAANNNNNIIINNPSENRNYNNNKNMDIDEQQTPVWDCDWDWTNYWSFSNF